LSGKGVKDEEGLTPKWRYFAEEYVRLKNAKEAYLRAYGCTPKVAEGNSRKLIRRPPVANYIQKMNAQLNKQLQREVFMDKKKIMNDLEGLKDSAAENKQFGPAVRAAELQGKELGMFRERTDISVRTISDEDLISAISAEDASLASELSRALDISTDDYQEV
jgi:phage terminase small subunit